MTDYQFATIDDIVSDSIAVLKPPPKMTVSEWADSERFLSAESSASPGRFRTEVVEYMREPMDMVGKPGVRRITLMTSAQVAKSTVIENIIGYFMHHDPCPILHVSPTLDSMKMFSKERLAPMIRDTPVLRHRVKDARARDSGNTLSSKTFPGGHIAMVGSNAPAGLASRPIRLLVADEVDRFEASAGTEGDPLTLAIKRTTTFWNRVICFVSTPGDKGTSRIEPEFLRGDQRYYWVPCPHCNEHQRLTWSQVKWADRNPETAFYECVHNGCVLDDQDRRVAVRKGEWRATQPFNGNVSYHLSQLYSPFAPLSDGVRDFLDSKDNPQELKTWTNTFLGETWEEKGARLEWYDLMDRREDYQVREPIPDGVTVITVAVDVQDNRFEMEWVGWGDDSQTWSLGYRTLFGDPSSPEVWQELRDALSETFIHPLFGEMTWRAGCIDSGGHYTQRVYDFAAATPRLLAIKGVEGFGKPIFGSRLKNTLNDAEVYAVGVDTAKETVVARLKVHDSTKAGYCRWPADYDEVYFRGLTAEELRKTYIRGFAVNRWHKIRPRNEPFDLRVYNTAAVEMLQVDLNAQRRAMLRTTKQRDTDTQTPKAKQRRRNSSWAQGWKE
jgi:phage terminase large subunit GpA-like protein